MADKRREMLALRVIRVSTRSALRHVPWDRAAIVDRAEAMLASLEASVLRDGADEEVLTSIARERRALRDDPSPNS